LKKDLERGFDRERMFKAEYEKAFIDSYHKIEFIAVHYLKDKELSRNVAQDVFILLWEKRNEIDFSRPLFPYLAVMAKNRCLNILKRQKIEQKFIDSHTDASIQLKIELLNSTSDEMILSKELDKLVAEAMELMSENTRKTFIMSRFENKKYDEIAEIQMVSVKTVEYRIMSALKVLRKKLKDFLIFI